MKNVKHVLERLIQLEEQHRNVQVVVDVVLAQLLLEFVLLVVLDIFWVVENVQNVEQ